jgi:hypothetical protein
MCMFFLQHWRSWDRHCWHLADIASWCAAGFSRAAVTAAAPAPARVCRNLGTIGLKAEMEVKYG